MKSKEMEEQISRVKVSSGEMGQAGAGCPRSPLDEGGPTQHGAPHTRVSHSCRG